MNHRFEFRRVTDTDELLDVQECVIRGESSEVPGSFLVGPANGWRVHYVEVNEDIDSDVLVTIYMEEIARDGFVMSTILNDGRLVDKAAD